MSSQVINVEVVSCTALPAEEFDYEIIADPVQRDWAESAAGMITFGLGQAVVKVLEAGSLLKEAKRRLKHGEYLPWVEQACGLKPDYAQRLVQAAEWVANVNPGHVQHLERITDTGTLFLLSADVTPEDVRKWVIERCAAGNAPTRKEVQERKRQAQGKRELSLEHEALVALKLRPEALDLAAKAEHISTLQLMQYLGVEEPPKGKRHQTADAVYCRNGTGWWKLPIQAPLDVPVQPQHSPSPHYETAEQHVTTSHAASVLGFKDAHALRNRLTPSVIKRNGYPKKNGYQVKPSSVRGMCYIALLDQ